MSNGLIQDLARGLEEIAGSIPFIFKGIERQYAKGNTPSFANSHDFHELVYVRRGRAHLTVADSTFEIKKGDNVIIRPGAVHLLKVESGSIDMVVLYFSLEPSKIPLDRLDSASLPSTFSGVNYATIESFLKFASGDEDFQNLTPYLELKGKSSQLISEIAEKIVKEKNEDNYGKELILQLLSIELFVALARGLKEEWEESLTVKSGKANELVDLAARYIVENHNKGITISEVASHVFLSQGYFTRVFKDVTGLSPMSFLIQVRIENACKLLENENIKVSGIAKEVGFASPQRFNAAFKKYTGMSPLEYRKKNSL